MIKHYIDLTTNSYIVEQDDKIIMSVDLDQTNDQVIIRTPNEVYAGPVDLIKFKED